MLGWELDKHSDRIRLFSAGDHNHLLGVEASLFEWSTDADEALIAAMNRELARESLHLLPIHNEAAVVDLQLVNQLRDELLPDAVACSKTGNS